MVKGILADINAIGQVETLVHQMQIGDWGEFWTALGLELKRFEDVGLSAESRI
jgi:hypothetical protein